MYVNRQIKCGNKIGTENQKTTGQCKVLLRCQSSYRMQCGCRAERRLSEILLDAKWINSGMWMQIHPPRSASMPTSCADISWPAPNSQHNTHLTVAMWARRRVACDWPAGVAQALDAPSAILQQPSLAPPQMTQETAVSPHTDTQFTSRTTAHLTTLLHNNLSTNCALY